MFIAAKLFLQWANVTNLALDIWWKGLKYDTLKFQTYQYVSNYLNDKATISKITWDLKEIHIKYLLWCICHNVGIHNLMDFTTDSISNSYNLNYLPYFQSGRIMKGSKKETLVDC
jgi:hypothetical protein